MQIHIDWSKPILRQDDALRFRPSDLNNFYAEADGFDKTNLFFVLLASFHHYMDGGDTERAARLSFLLAYYLFVPLTPPGSQALARHYIQQAVSLHPPEEYEAWRVLMERGN